MRDLCIFGSTGSIGISTLKVVRAFSDLLKVKSLCCNSRLDILAQQIHEFSPQFVAIASFRSIDAQTYKNFKSTFPHVTFVESDNPLVDVAKLGHDIVVSALVGAAGLAPTIASIPNCRRLALANKESLVMAGDIVLHQSSKHQTELLPIDSEHSALFMLLKGGEADSADIESLIVTASGGSLRSIPLSQMQNVTPQQALQHPTWSMGHKITIDSATLVNKGFEVIEAHYLFSMPYECIKVVVHPQSIVHALVELKNGALLAHMGVNDMVFPITNALLYPDNRSNPFSKFDLAQCGTLEFRSVDKERYPALELCYEAGKSGGSAPVVLNGANEAAVAAFLDKRIKFTDIFKVIEWCLCALPSKQNLSLEEIYDYDSAAKAKAIEYMERL